MSAATCCENTRRGFRPSRSARQITAPAALRTSSAACGVTARPPFGNVANAPAWSSTVTSSAPIGSEGVSGSGVRSPIALASATILLRPVLALPLPMVIESFTAMVLIERISALVIGIEPE